MYVVKIVPLVSYEIKLTIYHSKARSSPYVYLSGYKSNLNRICSNNQESSVRVQFNLPLSTPSLRWSMAGSARVSVSDSEDLLRKRLLLP
jgi:hypothetical protein